MIASGIFYTTRSDGKRRGGNRSVLLYLVVCQLVVGRAGPGGLVRINVRLGGRPGHAKLFVGPAAKIDQPAAFGTERTRRIVIPFGGLAAGGTFHRGKQTDRLRYKPNSKPLKTRGA